MTYFFADIARTGRSSTTSPTRSAMRAGSCHLLPLVERGVYDVHGKVAAPRVKVGADVLPWWPCAGVLSARGTGRRAGDRRPAEVAAWPARGGPPQSRRPLFASAQAGQQITYCFLDDDPVDTAERLRPVLEKRWTSGAVEPLFAAPFHTSCRTRGIACARESGKVTMRIGLMIGSDKERSRAERLAGLVADVKAADERRVRLDVDPADPRLPRRDDRDRGHRPGDRAHRDRYGGRPDPDPSSHPDGAAGADHAVGVRRPVRARPGPVAPLDRQDQLGLPYERPAHSYGTTSRCSTRRSRARARSTSRTTNFVCTARWTWPMQSPCRSSSPRSRP